MPDQILNWGHSTIQHGPDSDRVYLMELADADMPDLLPQINKLATKNTYGKIFAKVPARWTTAFIDDGFCTEALIPNFFKGTEDGHFMAKYFDAERAHDSRREESDKILALAQGTAISQDQDMAEKYTTRVCTTNDCSAMAACYQTIFPSYPFPVHDPAFLAATMAEHVTYFGVWHDQELAALASAEQYQRSGNVEMTDFLTMPKHRQQGLAGKLLATMDRELRLRGMTTAYTIARALSTGMNITFARANYQHGGTLINNTQICGRIESMQVWHKQLL